MIPGDIDLTENLDFRNVKKRNTPQLPAAWAGNKNCKLNVSNNGTFTITTRTNNDLRWNFYYIENEYGDSTTITTRGIREVHNRDLSWTYTTTSFNDDFDSTIYYWNDTSVDYLNVSPSTSSSSSLSVRFVDEPNYDVFGNRVKEPKQIPKFPWKFKEYTPTIHPIAWKRSCYKWSRFDEDYIPDIPWETEEDLLWYKRRPHINLSDYINRAKNLITWFNKKSSSFIERYFEDIEEVDTSYLTNMNWIRIHDAIID